MHAFAMQPRPALPTAVNNRRWNVRSDSMQKEYDCCAFMLCKELENILKAYLLPREQRDKNCGGL